jgi:hypothetical protein
MIVMTHVAKLVTPRDIGSGMAMYHDTFLKPLEVEGDKASSCHIDHVYSRGCIEDDVKNVQPFLGEGQSNDMFVPSVLSEATNNTCECFVTNVTDRDVAHSLLNELVADQKTFWRSNEVQISGIRQFSSHQHSECTGAGDNTPFITQQIKEGLEMSTRPRLQYLAKPL